MKKAKLCLILPWLWLFQDFSLSYQHTTPNTGSSVSIEVKSHLRQPMKAGTFH